MIEMPPVLTETGDIHLHGREGTIITLEFTDDFGNPRDVSLANIRFEMKNFGKDLVNGGQSHQKVLTITPGELSQALEKPSQFIVIDKSISPPAVVWTGKILVRGWL